MATARPDARCYATGDLTIPGPPGKAAKKQRTSVKFPVLNL
jgi:hypothetical protein